MSGITKPTWMLWMWCWALDYVVYEGLRVDMSALTLNRDILSIVTPALNRTLKATFDDLRESGGFWTELHIRHLKVKGYQVVESLFELNRFEYLQPIYKLKGGFEAICFHLSFSFQETWLGIPISTGEGSATVTNTRSEILVFFNESDPDVQIPHPWDVKNLTASGLFAPKTWLQSLLHKAFIPHFHRAVDDAMYDFAHLLLKPYRYIEDIFPADIDLVFRNDILSVTPTIHNNYLSIAFKTNITTNKHIHKKMYRRINETVVPKGDFDYCFAAELVPDVLDLVGKAGIYDMKIPPQMWAFTTNKVKEFFEMLPSLREKYSGEEEFEIFCYISWVYSTKDLSTRGELTPVLQLLLPEQCIISLSKSHDYVMFVDVFFKLFYAMTEKDQGYYGHVLGSQMYSFIELPELPTQRRNILESHLHYFGSFFTNNDLISPGIKVTPNRHLELVYDGSYVSGEQICFHYREKRPLLSIPKS